jgi:transcription termination factor Rho
MSMDATQLERSALEGKDRDELATIAEAMGQKPASRARKGEIIDQILELAGVTSGSGSNGGQGSDEPSSEDDGPQIDASADARQSQPSARVRADRSAKVEPAVDDDTASDASDRADTASTADASDEGSADEADTADKAENAESAEKADSDEKAETAEKADGDDTADSDKSESKNEGRSDRSGGSNRDGGQRQGGGQGRQGGQGNRQGGPGNQQGGQGNQQGGQGGDGEPGNRRRRRRGRDRDRPPGQGPDDQPFQGEPVPVSGMLDLRDEGYGFLRVKGFLPSKDDVYVSVKQVRQFGLRKGDHLTGESRPASRNEKNPALLKVDKVNDQDPEVAKARPRFEDLTPLFPDEKLALETQGDPTNMTARIVDLVSPIGKGQRGLIVSPPKAGKTTIMKQIARSIETNNPEVKLIVLLVDERPEEVTDMRRWVKGEVVASTFDRPSDEHTQVAELAIERAKRLVEEGEDVVIILDGITRLARAYNLAAPATGRIMSGGIDTGALYPPKKFFGAARNIEEGGSLTILATALVETGSRMDEVIFEEFKGTGNMELRLDRRLADRRIYPAIDVDASSTRHEELLFERKELQQVWKLRRVLSGLGEGGGGAGLELLIDRMKTFKSNDEFLSEIAKAGSGLG